MLIASGNSFDIAVWVFQISELGPAWQKWDVPSHNALTIERKNRFEYEIFISYIRPKAFLHYNCVLIIGLQCKNHTH